MKEVNNNVYNNALQKMWKIKGDDGFLISCLSMYGGVSKEESN
jgi:hypothetical protein